MTKKSPKVTTVVMDSDTPSLSFETQLWNFICDCGERGAMLMEMYQKFPNISERHVRTKVKEFTIKGMLSTEHTCRCGRGTIYIAKKFAKSKPLTNISKRSMSNKIKDIKSKDNKV
jgi:predicted DNA-binding transcriptional regulator